MTTGVRVVMAGGTAFVILALALTVGCQQQPAGVMTQEEATAFIDRVAQMWNEKKLDMLGDLYAPDVVWHHVGFAEDSVGLDGARDFGTQVLAAFPDVDTVIDDVLVAGDRVIIRFTQTGTNTGSWAGNPPTGKRIDVSGVAIYKLTGGKVVEEWDYLDELSLMEQLGYSLAPPSAEGTTE